MEDANSNLAPMNGERCSKHADLNKSMANRTVACSNTEFLSQRIWTPQAEQNLLNKYYGDDGFQDSKITHAYAHVCTSCGLELD